MEKYRVLYSEDIVSGEYFVDILPKEEDACHNDIMLERQKHNPNAHDRAGSIILYDFGEGSEPCLKFLYYKDNFLLSDYFEFDEKSIPLITLPYFLNSGSLTLSIFTAVSSFSVC